MRDYDAVYERVKSWLLVSLGVFIVTTLLGVLLARIQPIATMALIGLGSALVIATTCIGAWVSVQRIRMHATRRRASGSMGFLAVMRQHWVVVLIVVSLTVALTESARLTGPSNRDNLTPNYGQGRGSG